MAKEEPVIPPCPECGGDMKSEVVKKKSFRKRGFKRFSCELCGHTEMNETSWEVNTRFGGADYKIDHPDVIDKIDGEKADRAERMKAGVKYKSNRELL